jgi:hypothetical protein
VETIFAEKLETIISRGAANSRMKDYHDLLLLCREDRLLDKARLKDNIGHTFQNRGQYFLFQFNFTPMSWSECNFSGLALTRVRYSSNSDAWSARRDRYSY